jgi:head-tail adaptor
MSVIIVTLRRRVNPRATSQRSAAKLPYPMPALATLMPNSGSLGMAASHSENTAKHSRSITILEGEFMASIKGLASIVSELKIERTNLANRIRHVDAALTVLGKLDGGVSYTRPGRTLSASARKRISLAQKKRWAKVRDGSKRAAITASAPVKRTRQISAAGRKQIAAATRARWAKFRAAKKKSAA